nr:MAG TPA: hypothetical protein [Caudoviricetes sp.]
MRVPMSSTGAWCGNSPLRCRRGYFCCGTLKCSLHLQSKTNVV